jgi:methyl-accepting chemotaxis protein
MRLAHMRISTLLVAGCAMVIAVVAAVAILGGFIARGSNQSIQTLYEQRLVPLTHLKTLADRYGDVLFKANQIALGRGDPAQTLGEVSQSLEAIRTNWEALAHTGDDPQAAAEFQKARAVADKAAPALSELQDALAKKDRTRTSLVALDLNDLVNAIGKELNKLEQVQLDHSKEEFQQANRRYVSSISVFGTVIALVMVMTTVSAWLLIRQITQPIHQAVAIAKRVATGNMSEEIVYEGGSEMSEMLQALKDMQTSLGGVVFEVRGSADRLATASQEIAQGNMDLSDRTEQQATLLEQTSHATSGLSATVQENADKAQQANRMALDASQVAGQAGAVVQQVVVTMRDIDTSSKKIGDIIGVIDGIAFQTNILALNAAVEAARAGEQGRGFAVVATEVRALAGRSADAAREIKSLIHASMERVESGTSLVDHAGQTMTEVVAAIGRVTDIVGQISQSIHTQNDAVALVEGSVEQITQATQKNSALVEEIASSASDLNNQANILVSSVAIFKLGSQWGAAPSGLGARSGAGHTRVPAALGYR